MVHRNINRASRDYDFICEVREMFVKLIRRIDILHFALQLKLFSLQLQHQAPNVTCGFVDFDWSLYSSVSASP